MKLIKIF
jgi:hypothetical protein